MFELMDTCPQNAVIKVIGVGGGGGNAVEHMVKSSIEGVEFVCANTDAQALRNCSTRTVLQLGASITKGLGAGANPDVGRQAAMEDRDRVLEVIEGADMLFIAAGKGGALLDAFKAANNVLQGAVQGIAELITRPGLINVDFADVRTVMSEMGMAMMGSGRATGQDRARKAAEAAVNSPLLEDINLMGAKGILVNVTAGLDMAIGEFEEVGNTIKEFASDNATVVVGTVIDPQMSDELRVTVVATGLGREERAQEQPEKLAYKSYAETDYAQLARPTVIRHQNLVANGGRFGAAAAAEGHVMDYLDIPAFLRRQADCERPSDRPEPADLLGIVK